MTKPTYEELEAAIRQTLRLIDEALPKFNWAASALDANAIRLLNDTSVKVRGLNARMMEGDQRIVDGALDRPSVSS